MFRSLKSSALAVGFFVLTSLPSTGSFHGTAPNPIGWLVDADGRFELTTGASGQISLSTTTVIELTNDHGKIYAQDTVAHARIRRQRTRRSVAISPGGNGISRTDLNRYSVERIVGDTGAWVTVECIDGTVDIERDNAPYCHLKAGEHCSYSD
jgi:hypothetical protein